MVGVVLVGLGVLLVRGLGRHAEAGGIAFGLSIAATIASYTLVDKHGITHAAPITYLELSMIGPSLIDAGPSPGSKAARRYGRPGAGRR